MTHECPLCGYTADDDADDPKASVLAHMQGSADEEHSGIGYEKAKQMLEIHIDGTDDTDSVEPDIDGLDSTEHDGPREDREPPADGSATGEETSVSAGLGLSGDNPFKTSSTDGDETQADDPQADPEADESSAGGLVVLLGILGAAAALASKAVGNSQQNNNDEPEIL